MEPNVVLPPVLLDKAEQEENALCFADAVYLLTNVNRQESR